MRTRRTDLLTCGGYLAGSVYLLFGLWIDPNNRVLRDNVGDQVFFEWVLTHAARILTNGDNPFFTDQFNVPFGVNLMANTSMLGAAVPLTPVTTLLGPGVTFALLLTTGLAGTATAWYYVMSRHLVASRTAAIVGGGFCGFAPGMITHANSHPNIVAQYLVPFVVLAVLRLVLPALPAQPAQPAQPAEPAEPAQLALPAEPAQPAQLTVPAQPVRKGLVLAALVICQAFLNEELLLLTALAIGVFGLGYLGKRPKTITLQGYRTAALGLGVAALVAGVVLAYPLTVQFLGPQSYHGLGTTRFLSADLASYPAFAQWSLAGSRAGAAPLANPTEQNAFFGWPLLLLLGFVAWWRRSDPRVYALAIAGGVFGALSLGRFLVVSGYTAGIPMPWWLLGRLPVLDSVVPSRMALVVATIVGLLLALFVDHVAQSGRRVRRLGAIALVLALIPLIPVPLHTGPAEPVPRFFTTGRWRGYIPDDGVVLIAPCNGQHMVTNMRWQTRANLEFRIVGGYFLGPEDAVAGRRGQYGPPASVTRRVLGTGVDHEPDDSERAQVSDELRRWRVDTVVVAEQSEDADGIRTRLEQIIGPGTHVEDVWVWRLGGRR